MDKKITKNVNEKKLGFVFERRPEVGRQIEENGGYALFSPYKDDKFICVCEAFRKQIKNKSWGYCNCQRFFYTHQKFIEAGWDNWLWGGEKKWQT